LSFSFSNFMILMFFCHQIFKVKSNYSNITKLFSFASPIFRPLFHSQHLYFIVVILEPYPSSTEAIEYFKLNLQPILLKGLTAMAKLKPASDTINAVVSSPIHLHLHIWKTCFETFFNFLCTKLLERP
jgi:hypothetical protein